jgi:hypothetical protein
MLEPSQRSCFETEKNLYSNLPTYDGNQNRTNLAAVVIAPFLFVWGKVCPEF